MIKQEPSRAQELAPLAVTSYNTALALDEHNIETRLEFAKYNLTELQDYATAMYHYDIVLQCDKGNLRASVGLRSGGSMI